MILVVEQTDTLAKCEEFQKENKNGIYFYFTPKPLSFTLFSQVIRPMVHEALKREYNCAWFKSEDISFHLKYVPKSPPNGILFFHDGKCKAHMDYFDIKDYIAMLEALPGMSELVDEAAKEKEQAAVKKPTPKRQKDYDFKAIRQCTIL